jgi:hypothetical protein
MKSSPNMLQNTSYVKITVAETTVRTPVPPAVKAYFDSQFSRKNPSDLQRKRYKTLTVLMRLAYEEGRKASHVGQN